MAIDQMTLDQLTIDQMTIDQMIRCLHTIGGILYR